MKFDVINGRAGIEAFALTKAGMTHTTKGKADLVYVNAARHTYSTNDVVCLIEDAQARKPRFVLVETVIQPDIDAPKIRVKSSDVGGNTSRIRWYTLIDSKGKIDISTLRLKKGKPKPLAALITGAGKVVHLTGEMATAAGFLLRSKMVGTLASNHKRAQIQEFVHPSLHAKIGYVYLKDGKATRPTVGEYKTVAGLPARFCAGDTDKQSCVNIALAGDIASLKAIGRALQKAVK